MEKIGEIESGVLFGRNGYLFLAGGAHRVFEIVTGKAQISEASYAIFAQNLKARIAWAEKNSVNYCHIIMPDKQSIIPDQWPIEPPLRIGAAYLDRNHELREKIIYPVSILAEQSSRAVAHVDTHLTDYGSILVTKILVEKLSGEPQAEIANKLIQSLTKIVSSSGDLGSKLSPEIFYDETRFDAPQPGKLFHNEFPGGNNGGIDLRFNPDAHYKKRVAFFGDSFGRDIVRFLQFWYREVFFFRTGCFHEEIATLCKPDIVLTENVERYLDDCKSDDERPHFLLYPYLQSKAYAPTPEFAEALSAILSFPRKPYHDFMSKIDLAKGIDPGVPEKQEALASSYIGEFVLTDFPHADGLIKLLEEPLIVRQSQPKFISNFSGREIKPWLGADQDIHGSYLVKRENVLLFGPNHLVSKQGLWSCESRSFKAQFIHMLDFPAYNAVFPGRKPVISRVDNHFILKTDGLAPSDIQQIEEPVFLATPLEPDNWGRWIATVAPKARQFREHGAGRRFFCRAALPWQRAFLRLFGIDEESILEHNPGRTYLCQDVMTVEYSVTNMTISGLEREGFREMAAKFRNAGNKKSIIFVSRLLQSKKNPGYRVLQNETELQSELLERGFQSIEPETLPLEDQISLFANAEAVVCVGGAALYNTVFCRPGTKVVTIEASDAFISPHTQLISSLDLEYAIVFGEQDSSDPTPVHKRWRVNVAETVRVIDEFMGDASKP